MLQRQIKKKNCSMLFHILKNLINIGKINFNSVFYIFATLYNLCDALISLMFTIIDYHAVNECVFYVSITLIAINKRCVRSLTI